MVTYIGLSNFTDQGMRTVKDCTKRADAVKEAAKKFGVTMTQIYWTLGKYDSVAIIEAPDDASATAFALAIGIGGQYSHAKPQSLLQRRDGRNSWQAAISHQQRKLNGPAGSALLHVHTGPGPPITQGVSHYEKEISMSAFRRFNKGCALISIVVTAQCALAQTSKPPDQKSLDRGRYLVKIAGCNDCHTPGYM